MSKIAKLVVVIVSIIMATFTIFKTGKAESENLTTPPLIQDNQTILSYIIKQPTHKPIIIPGESNNDKEIRIQQEITRQNERDTFARESSSGTLTRDQVIELIKTISREHGLSSDLPLAIARAESGYDCRIQNSSSTALGVYQWLASSWPNAAKDAGVNTSLAERLNCASNIEAAVVRIKNYGAGDWDASAGSWRK